MPLVDERESQKSTHAAAFFFSYNELQVNLRHILSLSHFSASTLKSVFGNLGMLMPAGTKSLAVGKPFCVLLLVASPGLYTACPGCLKSLLVLRERNAKCWDTHAYAHLFAVVARTVGCTVQWHGRPDRLGLRSRESPSSCADMGPGAQVPDMFFSFLFFSFPFLLPANQPFCLPRIGMGFWMALRYSSM